MDLGLDGKHALVLGASRGLGAAIARVLAVEGARVTAAARTVDDTRAWIAALPGDIAARVTPLALDMSRRPQIDQGVAAIGAVDILVNNGGGPPPGGAADHTPETWIAQFEAMAANLFHLTQLVLPAMRERRWGRIITVSSSGVVQPIPNLALSNGVRAAVVGWSKSLATEVAAQGITVNVVLPGRIHTARVDQLDAVAAKKQGREVDEVARASMATIPAGRYGRPEEFADAVAFLASTRASYITGATIRIDGGMIRAT
jgi:3-oxoacyl-[acyl-carrier protein] reductase